MDELLEYLKRIDQRLATIETLMAKPRVSELVCKPSYSCSEVAELSRTLGVKKYRPYTVRLACSDGRVPEADKREDGTWALPRGAVLRVLSEGLLPERRNGQRPPGTQGLSAVANDGEVVRQCGMDQQRPV